MNISLHIERVILEGMPVDQARAMHVQLALEHELAKLLAAGGLPPTWTSGVAIHRGQAPEIHLAHDAKPAALGQELAGAVLAGLRHE